MKRFKITDIIIGILFSLFFISIGVIAAVNFRFIYYFDIKNLKIAEFSGYDSNVIIKNYNALIDYNSPFFKGALKFPSLPSSPEALQHFAEVKNIFVSFYYIAIITFILCLIIIFYKAKKKDKSYLRVSSITVLVLPLLVGIGCAINFDAAFVLFHKIFFRNNFWLFDPVTDPIITLLPDIYFLHALIIIIAIVLIGSLTLYLTSRIGRRRHYSNHVRKIL